MKRTGKCPKCDSTDIIKARAVDRGDANGDYDMSIATYREPEAWIFKGKQQTNISAWVCASCGFVEYYADSPKALKLWQAQDQGALP